MKLTPEQIAAQQAAAAKGQKLVYVIAQPNQAANNSNVNQSNQNNNNQNNGYQYDQLEGQSSNVNVNANDVQMSGAASSNDTAPPAYGSNNYNNNNNNSNNSGYPGLSNNTNSNAAKYDDMDTLDRNIAVAHYQSQVYNNTVQPGMMGVNNSYNDYNNYDEKQNNNNNINNNNFNGNAKQDCLALVDCLMNSDKDTNGKKRKQKMIELINLSVPKHRSRSQRLEILTYYQSVVNIQGRTFMGDIWNKMYLHGADDNFRCVYVCFKLFGINVVL